MSLTLDLQLRNFPTFIAVVEAKTPQCKPNPNGPNYAHHCSSQFPSPGCSSSSDSAIIGHKTIGLILTQVLQSLCGEGGKGFSIVVMSRKPSPTEVQVLFRQITSVEKKKMWILMLVSVEILDTDIRAGKQK